MSDNLMVVLIIAMCLATCNSPDGTDLVDRILADKECIK